ncbi:MAG: AmmeMemoRadiSam system radical SAM enzyme [Candidatus Micrarchaeota archaeon]
MPREAMLYSKLPTLPQRNVVRCNLCASRCIIPEGKTGFCLVRKNEGGKLFSLSWGKAVALAMDPIEKKPFFHFKPGSSVLSFGTPGCNFRCLNCQNWDLSQAAREFGPSVLDGSTIPPAAIADAALRQKAAGMAYTYSEPTVFFEYAYDTIQECTKRQQEKKLSTDFFHLFVSNGYFTKEMLDIVEKEKLLSAIRIDLKFMDDDKYYEITGGRLQPVLDSIKRVAALRKNAGWPIHLEVINLVIPGENDSPDDFRALSEFICRLSPDIPLHFSRFFPYYKMADRPATPIASLLQAKKIAQEVGLKYVYVGNTNIKGAENTYCPNCRHLLIERDQFTLGRNVFAKLKGEEKRNPICPKCGDKIAIVL